jgi:prepilin-type N-terminal cleavage/methylation domain-containing protein/prepilin-type processing-associated H-X9-DG protein
LRRRGFTLLELCIVFTLIAIALTATLVVYAGGRHASKRTVCLSNLRNIGLALQLYAFDNDGFYPPASPGAIVLDPYVKNRDVFHCPSAKRRRGGPGQLTVDFMYRAGFSNEDLSDEPVAGDDQPRHQGGANVVTLDGSVQWWPAARWRSFAEQAEEWEEEWEEQ